MLVISRKNGEQIHIGDDIVIKVVETRHGKVRIGVSAPSHVRVLRKELVERSSGDGAVEQTRHEA